MGYRFECMPFVWYERSNRLRCIKNFNRICVELSVIQIAWNGFSHMHGTSECVALPIRWLVAPFFSVLLIPLIYILMSMENGIFFPFFSVSVNFIKLFGPTRFDIFFFSYLLFIHFICAMEPLECTVGNNFLWKTSPYAPNPNKNCWTEIEQKTIVKREEMSNFRLL